MLAILVPLFGTADDERDARRVKMLEQMLTVARGTKVAFAEGTGEVSLVEKPTFRYDDQPRRLIDATVWTWMYDGRPIAFQKIEALDRDSKQWQICFTSLAEHPLQVQWDGGRKYQSKEAGVTYRAVPAAPALAQGNLERRKQLRELARSFSARILLDSRGKDSQEMRFLTTPLIEFDDAKTKLLDGAVFGYSTNGTNPDLLIVFLARPAQGKPAWHFAPARMTTGGITVSYGKKPVWECSFTEPGENSFPTWTYFQTIRPDANENK
ncbi:MAG: hypothetical protein ACR2FY_25280 [Pirellulaceae bacterium]